MNPFARTRAYALYDEETDEILFLLDGYARAQVYKLHGNGWYSTFSVTEVNPEYVAPLAPPRTREQCDAARTALVLLVKQLGAVEVFPLYLRQEDGHVGAEGKEAAQE